jgi:MoaA/NifB/PqqE/SkfB family radical SAM enzyme
MTDAAPVRGSLALKMRALERAQPLSACLELTYACNWRCAFCYNPRHHDLRPLSIGEWARVLDDLRALGTLNVTLTGGEPLAHPGFLEIARSVRERGFTLRLLTNGTLVTERLADEIAALRPLGVEMSIHGACAGTHERTTGARGSFEALLAAVDRLKSRGVRLVLKTVLTRLDEGELDAMIDLVTGLGVPYRVDSTLTPRDDGDRGPLAFRASEEAIERLYRHLARVGQLPEAERWSGGTNCGLGRVTVAVDPEGNVYPCMQWRHSALGNVRAVPLAELWRGSPVREEAARVARAANDRLAGAGSALARFPFCPALAQQRSGDPLAIDARHRLEAGLAEKVRAAGSS